MRLSKGITSTTGIRGGRPCIQGTRVDVLTIVNEIISGSSMRSVQDEYSLSEDQVWNAITFALKSSRLRSFAR